MHSTSEQLAAFSRLIRVAAKMYVKLWKNKKEKGMISKSILASSFKSLQIQGITCVIDHYKIDICASDRNPRKVLIMISRPVTWVQRQLYQVAVFQSILIVTLPSAGTDLISMLWIASPFYRRLKHRLVAYPLIGSSKFMPLIVDGFSITYSKMITMMVWWWWLMVSSVGYQCSLSDVVCLFHDGVW